VTRRALAKRRYAVPAAQVASRAVPEDEEVQRSTLAKYLRYSHVGFQFFLAVGLLTAGGIWLDRRLGTVVLFTLLGLALGFAGGFLTLYREFNPGKPRSPGKQDSRQSNLPKDGAS
jgi:F0F1-type ATP synthase assembly protein I